MPVFAVTTASHKPPVLVGEPYQKQTRGKYSLPQNDTPSSNDHVFADGKGESPSKVVLSTPSGKVSFTRNAAHSSTLPALIAYDPVKWQAYKEGLAEKPQGMVFLKGTDAYRLQNATMNMPRWVNNADILIDGTSVSPKLRIDALAIIQKASIGLVTPEEGVHLFLEKLDEQIKRAAQKSPLDASLKIYSDKIDTLIEVFQENADLMFTMFLDLNRTNFSSFSNADLCRRKIYEIRYKAIQTEKVGQTKLIQKINKVSTEILAQHRRKPPQFDAAFKAVLISEMKNYQNQMEKLLSFSPADFRSRLANKRSMSSLNYYERAQNHLKENHTQKIKILAKDLIVGIRDLQRQEILSRASVTRELRDIKDWTQTTLGKKIKAIFKHAACSQSTISRMENQQKTVTPQIAEELSVVFGVDPGLFMPQFFYA